MSLAGAMNTAVSALNAQSQALSMISDNLANSSTTGYKAVTASFSSLVSQQFNTTSYPSGGVTSSVRQNVTAQGIIENTTNSTDLALDGNGFFVVSYGTDGQEAFFTRNGEFEVDDEGYLTLGNYYLQGWETDSDGNVLQGATNSSSSLEPVNVNRYSGMASATTSETIKANLPSGVAIGNTVDTSMEVIDSLGTAHNVTLTFEKTASNTWELTVSDPSLASNASQDTGDSAGGPWTITFDSSGNLSSTSPSPVTLTISGWTTGAGDSSITLDVGEAGSGNRLTQKDSGDDISVTNISGDGIEYGAFTGVEIGSDGTVTANYDNGQQLPIYKLAIATFPNANGLSAMSDGIYEQSTSSGDFTLHLAGEDGCATVQGSSLETSTVDTGDEFTRMIVAQQAYSAASQVISTTKDMFDDLIAAIR